MPSLPSIERSFPYSRRLGSSLVAVYARWIRPWPSTVTRLSGRGRSSVESQKSTACRATCSSDQCGANLVSPGFSPRNIGAWDLPTI